MSDTTAHCARLDISSLAVCSSMPADAGESPITMKRGNWSLMTTEIDISSQVLNGGLDTQRRNPIPSTHCRARMTSL